MSVPLPLMKPSFRNLFMKTLTRERVVPTISASVSCEIFGSTLSTGVVYREDERVDGRQRCRQRISEVRRERRDSALTRQVIAKDWRFP